MKKLLLTFSFLLLMGSFAFSQSNQILVIWDVQDTELNQTVKELKAEGYQVTLSPVRENEWDGTNPSTANYEGVLHYYKQGKTPFQSQMPASGKSALESFRANGGVLVSSNWNATHFLKKGLSGN